MNSIRPYLPVGFRLDSTPANPRNLPNTIYTITYAFLFSTTMTRDRRPWGLMRAQQRYEITTNISYSVLNNPNVSISVRDALYFLLLITFICVLLQSFGILLLPSSSFWRLRDDSNFVSHGYWHRTFSFIHITRLPLFRLHYFPHPISSL